MAPITSAPALLAALLVSPPPQCTQFIHLTWLSCRACLLFPASHSMRSSMTSALVFTVRELSAPPRLVTSPIHSTWSAQTSKEAVLQANADQAILSPGGLGNSVSPPPGPPFPLWSLMSETDTDPAHGGRPICLTTHSSPAHLNSRLTH